MKKPTLLDKEALDMKSLAELCLNSYEYNFKDRKSSEYDIIKWLMGDDIYIYQRNEKGFEDWDEEDYAINGCPASFEPSASFIGDYVIVYDYQ